MLNTVAVKNDILGLACRLTRLKMAKEVLMRGNVIMHQQKI